ncbi:hypothetical protein HDV00_005800 [Rhizophlyctis rosea]|nr:hypothetical protein HDV00_005800 [Rhizophlyctis rosea]
MNLAGIYVGQRKFHAAEELYQIGWAKSNGTLGDEHPFTLKFLYQLAISYQLQREIDAEPLLKSCLEGWGRVLSDSHPDTRRAGAALIECYENQGKLVEARILRDMLNSSGGWVATGAALLSVTVGEKQYVSADTEGITDGLESFVGSGSLKCI